MGAFQVALLAVTPGTERGISMGIMTTFRGVGGLIAPVVGGYFLNEALHQVVTFDQAFTNIFLTATAGATIAFVLLAYFIFRLRNAAKPVPPSRPGENKVRRHQPGRRTGDTGPALVSHRNNFSL